MEKLRLFEEIAESEDLCSYCEQTDYGLNKCIRYPDGVDFCEGRYCSEAYEEYLKEMGVSEDVVKYANNVKLINGKDIGL